MTARKASEGGKSPASTNQEEGTACCAPTNEPGYRPPPRESSDEGAAVWLGSGGQMMRPGSSNFMPREKPTLTRISLISLRDLRPKFLVLSISFSLFCTRSRMVRLLA